MPPPRKPRRDPEDDESTFRAAQAGRPSRRTPPWEAAGGPGLFERVVFGRIRAGQLALFCRQAAAFLDAGVNLTKAFEALRKQFARTALGPVLDRLEQAIRRGETLSDALGREPQAFDGFFLSTVRVAEARGGLPEALRRLARHYESRQRLIRQARSALIYPTIVLFLALVVGWFLTVYVLPMFVELLADMTRGKTADLPGPTRALMALSRFMARLGWWLVPAAAVAAVLVLTRCYRTAGGKAVLDRLLLAVPVLGPLLRKIDTARFAESMSALLDAGVPFDEALALTAEVVRMSPMKGTVRKARSAIDAGEELSAALERSRQFAPDVIATIETGEETGTLPESLERLAQNYEEQVEYAVRNLGSLIQPLLMLAVGGFVFFVVIGFVLAYVSVILTYANP